MDPTSSDPRAAALLRELDLAARTDRDGWVEQLTRAELAQRPLHEQLEPAVGGQIRIRLAPVPDIEGRLMRVGRDHLWVADAEGFWLVATAQVDAIVSGPAPSRVRGSGSRSASGLGAAMRELIAAGTETSVLVAERWFTSRLAWVGADFAQFEHLALPLERLRACRVWY